MNQKRICMVVFMYYPLDPRVRREATALRRNGMDIDVYCLRQDGEKDFEVCDGVNVYRIMDSPSNKEKILAYVFHTLRFTGRAMRRITRNHRRKRYDLFHVHTMPDYLIFSCVVAKFTGRKIVLDLHDLSVELFRSKLSGASRGLLPLVGLQEWISCRIADHLITTSPGFQQKLVERHNPPEKITLILNSADPTIFQFDRERSFSALKDNLTLFYHGTVAERFGVIRVIEALPIIRREYPKVRFEIYGKFDPTYEKSIRETIQNLDVADSVRIQGWIGQKDLPGAFRKADIAIVPYLYDEFMDIAISTKTFEYAACGLPVVASRLNSISSMFSDGCVSFVEPGDPASIASGVIALARNPDLMKKQAEKAHDAQLTYSGTIMAQRLHDLMRSL